MDDELEPEAVPFVQSYRKFLTSHYGERCSDREPGCIVCKMWALYDCFEISLNPR